VRKKNNLTEMIPFVLFYTELLKKLELSLNKHSVHLALDILLVDKKKFIEEEK